MKKRILNLIAVLVLVSVSLFANTNPSIRAVGTKALILDTKEWKSEFVSVQIKDAEGVLLFNENYTNLQSKKFNFKNLPNGQYSIVLSDELKSVEQFFTLSSNSVKVLPNITTDFKPIINIKEDYIDLNYLASGKNTLVSISDDNDVFYNLKIRGTRNINKRFDTSALPRGRYTVIVSSNNLSYTKTFNK